MNATKLYEIKTKHFIKDTKKVKFPGSVMIGCTSVQGVGFLHFLKGNTDAVKNQIILETSFCRPFEFRIPKSLHFST